ncbi:MAG: hypothetical protein L3J70_09855, partial [Gammaproteobacteria bacterium]|nr:hypothetical protein [Gammaproteobacteria bacterium]
MSANKHPQQPLKNNQKSEDADTSGTDGSLNPPSYPLINTLNRFERNEALKQLASQISRVCSSSSNSDDSMTFPLEDLPSTLQLLAELAIEAKANDSNREEKSKILHLAAVMLRRVLHMPEANHYRVLGLDSGATSTQIAEHYRLLHELFWFDGTIDPQQKSRLRIFEAYTALKESESRQRYDEEQKLFEQLESSSGRSGLWRVAAVALPVILGLSVFMFYLEKSPDTEVASLQEKSPDSYAVINESAEPGKSDVAEVPIKESLQVEVETTQQRPTQPTDTVFLPEEVPEVIHTIEENAASEKAYVAEIQVDDNVQLPNIIPKPPLDMVSTETPYIEKPERVAPQIKEPIQVKQAERQVPSVVSS